MKDQTITLRSASARAEILPGCGGTVDRLDLSAPPTAREPNGTEAIAVLAAQPAEERRGACEPGYFRGRLLAPFNDRIPGGIYRFEGREYELPINDWESGDAIHGFLYPEEMELVSREESNLELAFQATAERWPGYPFELELRARYELGESSFRLDLTGTNRGHSPLPLALGWHPYFQLPGSAVADELALQVAATRYVEVDENLLPTGAMPPVRGSEFDFGTSRRVGPGDIDLAFRLDPGVVPSARLSDGRYRLSVTAGDSADYLQLFVPPDRRSIAVEPVTSATDSFNRPELGRSSLEPGESLTLSASVALSVAS